MAASETPKVPLYGFEQADGRAGRHRDLAAARRELEVLWGRLDGAPPDLAAIERHDAEGWAFLLRYITDGPLCIQWYEARRPELERKQARYGALVMTVAFVLFALAFLLPFQPLIVVFLGKELSLGSTGSSTGLVDVAALLGVVGTGTTVALRLSSVGIRYRRQAAVFHKASATLKEQLYRLETDWRGKPLVQRPEGGAARLDPAFDEALRRAVATAQLVLADERDAYFDTLVVDVGPIAETVTSATETLARRTAVRSDPHHEDAQRRQELEARLADARLAEDTARAKIAVLEQELTTTTDERTLANLRAALLDQRLASEEAGLRRQQLEGQLRAP